MKYYLAIDGVEFDASQMEIMAVYRRETTQTNLNGDLLVDRVGTEKLNVTAKLNLVTIDQMKTLITAREKLKCTAVFDRGADRVTKEMHLTEFTEPSPIYHYGVMAQGITYGTLEIKLEEL